MKNFKLASFLVLFITHSIICEDSCVEFINPLPTFSKKELDIVKEYLPTIVYHYPDAIAKSYLDTIFQYEKEYKFSFLNYSHLRSYKCANEEGKGYIKLTMDGGWTVVISRKDKKIIRVEF